LTDNHIPSSTFIAVQNFHSCADTNIGSRDSRLLRFTSLLTRASTDKQLQHSFCTGQCNLTPPGCHFFSRAFVNIHTLPRLLKLRTLTTDNNTNNTVNTGSTTATATAAVQHSTASDWRLLASRQNARTNICAELDHWITTGHQSANSTTSALPRRSSTVRTRHHRLDTTDSITRTRQPEHDNPSVRLPRLFRPASLTGTIPVQSGSC
jgi:hypothetical protein